MKIDVLSDKYNPTHHKQAEFWRLCGRDNTLTGQQFDVTPHTIAKWRDTEDWKLWADRRDRLDAEELAALSLQAATRHTQETDALLTETRALLKQKLIDVRGRMATGANVDEPEFRTIGQLLDICVSAGAKKYGAAAIKIEKTVTNVGDAGQEAERIRAQRETWKQQVAKA